MNWHYKNKILTFIGLIALATNINAEEKHGCVPQSAMPTNPTGTQGGYVTKSIRGEIKSVEIFSQKEERTIYSTGFRTRPEQCASEDQAPPKHEVKIAGNIFITLNAGDTNAQNRRVLVLDTTDGVCNGGEDALATFLIDSMNSGKPVSLDYQSRTGSTLEGITCAENAYGYMPFTYNFKYEPGYIIKAGSHVVDSRPFPPFPPFPPRP